MGQKPINAEGGESPIVQGRVTNDQAAWLVYAQGKYSMSRSDLVRFALDVARLHEKELEKRAS